MTGRMKTRKTTAGKPSVAIVGAGRLARFLAVALRNAGFKITEIVVRDATRSRRRGRSLAASVRARAVTFDSARLDATLVWFCVPDGEIRGAAWTLADRAAGGKKSKLRFAFHSSGALPSSELDALRAAGVGVASVHPLMTFVAGSQPSLKGVPFALEGDGTAMRVARQIVRELGGVSFSLRPARKAAYHAWATLASPLLLAFLVTLEEAASAAGLTRQHARGMSVPIIIQTLKNYSRLGAERSFSGPLVRGDADTVAKHLASLTKHPEAREVYVALARAALRSLPVKNQIALRRLLED